MKTKPQSPFDGGLCARIYLAAYPTWRTCYEIAKLIFPFTKPRNIAGKISKEVSFYREYFDTKLETLTEFKVRTLVISKHQPFLRLIQERCNFTPEEVKALEPYLNSEFRKAFGIYLDSTLKVSKDYLARDLDAFAELTTLLAFILYLGRLYNKYVDAKDFVLKLAELIMPNLSGSVWQNPQLQLEPLNVVVEKVRSDMLERIYAKLKTIVPNECKPLLAFLEGLERFMDEIPKNAQMRRTLMEGFLKAWKVI
jgi:hypothetical protein